MRIQKRLPALLLALLLSLGLLSGCGGSLAPLPSPEETGLTAVQPAQSALPLSPAPVPEPEETQPPELPALSEDGSYTSPEDVAEYLVLYEHLPDNFITKNQARDLGWDSSKCNLWDVAPGMSIGGDRFGNYEGLLPDADGRRWTECDVNYEGGYRGAERIIFSNDGLIYYTDDHYKSFTQLWP